MPAADSGSVPLNLDAAAQFWATARLQLTPFNRILVVPGDVFRAMDSDSKSSLLDQLRSFLNLPCISVQDLTEDRVLMGPSTLFPAAALVMSSTGGLPTLNPSFVPDNAPSSSPTSASSPAGSESSETSTPTGSLEAAEGSSASQIEEGTPGDASETRKMERVPRPSNAFILYRRDNHPIIKAANPGIHNNEISVILGKQWRNETAQVRTKYKLRASQLKEEHHRKHPGYQYRPRRPCEKKRRMTKKKRQAAAAQSASLIDSLSNPSPTQTELGDDPEIEHQPRASHPPFSFLQGSWAEAREGILPTTTDGIEVIRLHNESVTDPISGFPTATIAPVGGWCPSQEWDRAQLDDLNRINWSHLGQDLTPGFAQQSQDILRYPFYAFYGYSTI